MLLGELMVERCYCLIWLHVTFNFTAQNSFEIKHAWQKQSVNTDILLRKFLGSSATDSSHSDFSKSSAPKPVSGQLDPDAHIKAGEIVKQITEESGLSVEEIVSKYARQAEAIKSTFTQPGKFTLGECCYFTGPYIAC